MPKMYFIVEQDPLQTDFRGSLESVVAGLGTLMGPSSGILWLTNAKAHSFNPLDIRSPSACFCSYLAMSASRTTLEFFHTKASEM